MRRKIYEEIAHSLRNSIIADPSFVLLPINELAAKYDVSYPTMWKAVRILVDEGLIATLPGRAIRIAPHVKAAASSRPTPGDRVYEIIRARIADGTFRVGSLFPKVGYFAATEGVSPLTVLRAFSGLAKENLAHKHLNRWRVGPTPSMPAAKRLSSSDTPVVLVVSESSQTFTTGYTDPFSQRFTAPFADECMTHGISLHPALLAGAQEETPGIPVGIQEAKAAIRRLGSRYQGTLVLSAFPRQSGVDRWVETMAGIGRPVVFFDHTDTGEFLTRKSISMQKGFFRMHLHDRAGVRVALQTLHETGHSVIGVHGSELHDWSRRRMTLIRECAREFIPAMEIAEADPAEPVWNMYARKERYTSIVALVQAHGRGSPATAAEVKAALMHATPSLMKLLHDHHPTALISFNDEIARDYVFWFHAAGIHIPKDMSLIAFDNTPTNFLVSSIDWGLSRLGYLAAHIFIGDIPIRAHRDGSIPGMCTMVDRGSCQDRLSRARIRR